MVKTIAIIFGIILLIVGIIGFIPALSPNNAIFGIFKINALHNFIHIVTGIIAIWVGSVTERASILFFQIFGVIYGIIAILGFFYMDSPIFGIVANNIPDAWLHVVIAVFSLVVGFGSKKTINNNRT